MNKYLTAELIAACLDDIASGKMTIEECVTAHPGVSDVLPALLETARTIPPLPDVALDPVYRLRGRQALLASIAKSQDPGNDSAIARCWERLIGVWQAPLSASKVVASLLIFAVVTAITAGGGVVYASQDALPGEPFYQVKTAVEGLELALATDDASIAKARLEHAARRLAEIGLASQIGKAASAAAAADALVRQVDEVEGHLVRLSSSGKDVRGIAELLADSLVRQQEVLAAVEGRVPDKAKAAIIHAGEKSARALTIALTRGRDVVAIPGPRGETPSPPTEARASTRGAPAVPSLDASSTPTASTSITSTASPTFTQAISRVHDLAMDPKTPGRSFNGLLAKLQAARAFLDRGQTRVSTLVLDAFLGELNALKRSGHIGDDKYQALYAIYIDLVAAFGTASKSEETSDTADAPPGQDKPAETREKQPGKQGTHDQSNRGAPKEAAPRSQNGQLDKQKHSSPTPTPSTGRTKPGTSPPSEGIPPKGKP